MMNIIEGYELVWWGSYKCPYCNNTIELDDFGMPDNNIRKAILEAYGEWGLYVNEDSKGKTIAIKFRR